MLLAPSCARRPAARGPERLAILRFENLDRNADIGWMGRAFSEAIWSELTASPDLYTVNPARIRAMDRALGPRPISAPGVSAELASALAAGANRIGYGFYWISNGRLEARLIVRDPAERKDLEMLSASAAKDNVAGAASALARQVSPRAGAPSSSHDEAWKAYVTALESQDPSVVEAQAGQAIAADPDFGPAYRILMQVEENQDREGALALAAKATARSSLQPVERARLEIASAEMRADRAAAERGLAALAKLAPGDTETWRLLAETAFRGHDYRLSTEAWQKFLAAEPEDASALNELGYAAAYAGDFKKASAALHDYAALRPREVNPLDSLGDIYLITGRLKEAEGFYIQAAKKDTNAGAGGDWFKAAMARLMTGDVSGSGELAGYFADALSTAQDPAVPMFHAQWQWMTGRRQEAYHALEGFARGAEAGRLPGVASRAYAQLAIWSLVEGDRAAGEAMSMKAASLVGPASRVEAAAARFLALPPAPAAEWQARAERLAPLPGEQAIRDSILAYALLLSRQFGPAAEALDRLHNAGTDIGDPAVPVLLAWCYLETGRAKDAAPLLEFNPTPPPRGPGLFTSFYFPRIYDLRARLAQAQGRTDEAEKNRKLYVALSDGR